MTRLLIIARCIWVIALSPFIGVVVGVAMAVLLPWQAIRDARQEWSVAPAARQPAGTEGSR